MTKLHFCRSNGLGAWVIRTFTMSDWNHVAIEIDDVIFHSTGTRGVHVIEPAMLSKQFHTIETIEVNVPDERAARYFANRQLGKAYDWGAVFGMFFRAGWHHLDKWFCSEFTAAVLEAGGKSMRLPHHRVTPRDQRVAI